MFGLTDSGFSAADLDRFRHHQRQAFAALETVGATLQAGDTERAIARRIHRQLKQAGDAVILDAAPIFEGYTVDASYSLRFGEGGVPPALDQALAGFRASILERVRAKLTMREIARQVEAEIKALGLENCHRKHFGMVLGHRVTRENNAFLRGRAIWGLAPRQIAWFFLNSYRSRKGKPEVSPNWNHTRQSACPAPDGLWAIEPHVAQGGFGAKFEDILVVQDGQAYYLDNDLPHTRRWRAAGLA